MTLWIVATPIGNLEDITLRALRVLTEANAIYAEDTRVTSRLLARYEIKTSVYRLDAATEGKKAIEIIARLEKGEKIAFVSDAGTPCISDPGARLVMAVREALPDARIEVVPGPSALTAALSMAGIPSDEFTFVGFLPHKKGRATALGEIQKSPRTIVLFESPHRIGKLLNEFASIMPEREIVIARELTKIHEELRRGTPDELKRSLELRGADRGEFVVIVPAA